jgi:hypothetical protein
VSRNWYSRNDAVTLANSLMGSCGWFVPSVSQLQNPGSSCRIYWDSYSSTYYWSSTEHASNSACVVYVFNGLRHFSHKIHPKCVRAFRCTST